MRALAVGLLAVFALGGCVTDSGYLPPPQSAPPISSEPQGQNSYTFAARAPVHSDLLACQPLGANVGEIGGRGETIGYTPYLQTPAGALLRNPTESACLSSGFGWRWLASGGDRQHNGLDLANASGGLIYAAAEGIITSARWRRGYGIAVEINHGSGVSTLYGHLDDVDPNLRPGAFVAAGQAVGRMGRTGNATGVHLHYEVIIGDRYVDPLRYGREEALEPVS